MKHWTKEKLKSHLGHAMGDIERLMDENKELRNKLETLRTNQVAVLASRYDKMNTYFPKPATQYELGYQAACNEISMRLDEFYLYGRRSR